jgi:colanic acid biosynthesis glycosyl transferase WcaI
LRFLILTQYFPPEVGAPQVRLLAIAKELQRRGHKVDVVTAMPNYPTGKVFPAYRGRWIVREDVDGLPVTRTWIYAASGSRIRARLFGYFSFAVTSLAGCLRIPRPDLIFVESPPLFLGFTAWLASRLRRTRYVFNVSDLWPESAVQLGIITNRTLIAMAEALERFCYRRSHRVCAVTDSIRDRISTVPGAAPVLLLPNGTDLHIFRKISNAAPNGLAPGEVTFLFAGTHGYAQGLDVILEAAALMRQRVEIRFLLVGDGPEKPRLRKAAAALANVSFLDSMPVTAMPELYSACRASIVPLRKVDLFKGARPSKILPSLACETPVIYAGEGETAELIKDSACGLVVAPECPEELAAAVTKLAGDQALARRLGKNGRRLVESRFSWENIVGRWLEEMGQA